MRGVIYLIVALFIVYVFSVGLQKSESTAYLIVVILICSGFFLFFTVSGYTQITRKITITSNNLVFKDFINDLLALAIGKRKEYSIIESNDIKSLEEISKPSWREWREEQLYKDYGISLILGTAFTLEIQRKSTPYPFVIKNIRSFKNYADLYKEIEKLTNKKIKRNIQSWKE